MIGSYGIGCLCTGLTSGNCCSFGKIACCNIHAARWNADNLLAVLPKSVGLCSRDDMQGERSGIASGGQQGCGYAFGFAGLRAPPGCGQQRRSRVLSWQLEQRSKQGPGRIGCIPLRLVDAASVTLPLGQQQSTPHECTPLKPV